MFNLYFYFDIELYSGECYATNRDFFSQNGIHLGVKFLFANKDEGRNDFEENLRNLAKILEKPAKTQKVDRRVATKKCRIALMDSQSDNSVVIFS